MTGVRRLAWLPAVAILWAAATGELAGQTLRGRVVDTSTEAAVPGATLRLLGPASQVVAAGVSADDGRFALSAPAAGEYQLEIERLGYQSASLGPFRLRAGGLVEVTVALGPAAIPVDPFEVEVEGRVRFLDQAGFYERRRRTVGQFLERAEIEALHLQRVSEVLATLRGVRVLKSAGESDVQLRGATPRAFAGPESYCLPRIYLDGVLGSTGGAARDRTLSRLDLDALRAEDVEAIELYVGSSTVPSQFARDGAPCGAIAIWRRR